MSDMSSATDAIVPTSRSGLASVAFIPAALVLLLVVSLAVVVLGAFHSVIGGDEYIFLSTIHRAVQGEPVGLLQSAYVHLYRWLPAVGDEFAQVMVGRLINFGLFAISLLLLHRLGRHLLDPVGALAGVVLFAIFSLVVLNASSFRADVLLLPLLLGVALLLLDPTIFRTMVAGALSGMALALTIKAVLWIPAFFGVLAVGLADRRDRLRPTLAGAVAGSATFIGILGAHHWLTAPETSSGPAVTVDQLANVGTYMFFDGFFPQSRVLIAALMGNSVTWILMIIGIGLALAGLRAPQSSRNSLILLFLATPVLSVSFYTNAFPYAYLVLMPTACLLAGKAFSRYMGTAEGLKGVTALFCLGIAAVPMIFLAWQLRYDQTQGQKEILAAVHQLFEEPVPYIDLSGMVASFPRRMLPITRLGLSGYRKAGVPAVTNYIHASQPPLLIVNSASLDVWAQDRLETLAPEMRLLPQDEEAIRAAYAQYRDQIYLAGRQWRDLGAGERREFEIIVPGDHTLLAENAVTVDGRTFAPGATITLEAGLHELRTTAAEPDLRILWGKGLKLPSEDGQP